MSFFEKLFGSFSDKELKRINPLKDKVLALEPEMAKLTDDELKAKTTEFKERLAKGETLDDLLPEAFAVCREADWRVLGMKPYPVQIIGGIVLHRACIAEMQTGEGKTLVATMPTYLNALTGEGVHVVTVNDYLARRDSEWMGKVYRFLGLTVGLVVHGVEAGDRKKAYEADVTYGTNNEFGFDYLRDNMVVYKANMVQRGHAFAIVDEVDSILIDEARTPLIISGKGEDSSVMYKRADDFAKTLKKSVIVELDDKVEAEEQVDGDYVVDEKRKTATLTESGVKKAEAFFHVENLADADNMSLRHYIDGAIKARGVMHRDTDYIVKDGEVIIVDEFTGRLMYGRRFNDGLHQAIEAKEGVTVAAESKTLATVTFQNYFRMYKKLSGMTGTASTEADEFSEIYGLNIVSIPTNKPRARKDLPDSVYKTVNGKYNAVIEQVAECHAKGQPVLVGTVSVEKSEALSKLLKKKGIEHNVLNAKQHEREAEIVAQAGKQGAVTIATNMAGRGTDIMLGGNVTYMAKAALKKELSKELTANLAELKDAYEHEKARAKASGTELPTPPEAGIDAKLEILMTECDGHAETEDAEILHARKRFEELCEEFTPEVKREAEVVRNAGGLFIIGTERHESRRVDRQLMAAVLCGEFHRVRDLVQQRGERKACHAQLHAAVVQTRKRQQVGHDTRHALALTRDHAEELLFRIERNISGRVEQGLGVGADIGERRAQLMRDIRHELAPRVVQTALLGDIVQHGDHAAHNTVQDVLAAVLIRRSVISALDIGGVRALFVVFGCTHSWFRPLIISQIGRSGRRALPARYWASRRERGSGRSTDCIIQERFGGFKWERGRAASFYILFMGRGNKKRPRLMPRPRSK